MKVLVAGAGIGGLGVAVALRRAGHEVVVVERAAELSEVGAGVGMSPHAMRCLDHLGVTPLLSHITFPEKIGFKDMIGGHELYETTLGPTGEAMYGAPFAVVHRRDLIDALARQIPPRQVLLGSEVVGAEQDDRSVRLRLADGSEVEGDLLVGADGLRSTVRTLFFGEMPGVFTGYLAWRAVIPVARYGRAFDNRISIWLGAGRHVISYPIRDASQIYAGCYVPADEVLREDWGTSGDVEGLKASFADACPELREVVAGVDTAFITGIYYRTPLDTWHKGRTVLVGDAAHPVLPTSGSGAGLALEDAVALSASLGRHGHDHEAAFAEFEMRRKPRTSRVLAISRADLRLFQEEDPERRALRLRIDAGMGRIDPTGRMRLSWLYCHDEVAESAKPLDVFLRAHGNPLRRPEARRAYEMWKAAAQPEDIAAGWTSERAAFRRAMAGMAQMPAGVAVEEVEHGGVPMTRIVPAGGEAGPAVLHFPGGGHAFGPSPASSVLAARIAQALGGWALVPHVRLVPEHSAADQLEDALAAHGWVSNHSARIVLSGEGGGACLAVRLAMALRDRGGDMPAALYLLSPFVDMTISSASIASNAQNEAWMELRRLLFFAAAYTQGVDPARGDLSPVHAELGGLPPALIFAAEKEALADDARSLAARIRRGSGEARLTLVEDSVHSFALFDFLPETTAFLAAVAKDAAARIQPQDLSCDG